MAGSLASAAAVLPELFRFYRPESAVDVGCGLGAWLKVARDLGVRNILGLDGDYIDRAKLLIDPDEFQAADLGGRIVVERRFGLAISVEVAEHLPYARSESFIADLTALGDVVLFSAAAPYQGGAGHINEQWLEFWGILFRRFGYMACDVLRPRVWGNPAVEFWYQQNLMIFCKAETAAAIFPAEAVVAGRALSIAHPMSLLINATRCHPLPLGDPGWEYFNYMALVRAYLSGDTALPPLKTVETAAPGGVRGDAADTADIERLLRELEDCRRGVDGLKRELEIRDSEIALLKKRK